MAIDLSKMAPGALIAEFSPPPSMPEDLARYAKASGDLNPLHLDIDFARQAGFDNLVVHGMLSMAHLGRLLTDNFPVESIRSFSVRFEGVVMAGQSLKCIAHLDGFADGCANLTLEGLVVESGKRAVSGKAAISIA